VGDGMISVPYTEDKLVQQTTAEYLEKELGWKSLRIQQ
jgi:type I restriction enzyme R subunit